jgi:hypothetical protein
MSLHHISQFADLWMQISGLTLLKEPCTTSFGSSPHPGLLGGISIQGQFEGTTCSYMMEVVWKNWAPPKCKKITWFVFQDRVWMTNYLQRRGWHNCGCCKFCNREDETEVHLLFKCRYLILTWSSTSWLGLSSVDTTMCGQTMTRLRIGGSR